MSELSVLAVHGVGAGEGAARKGFSKELKRLVFPDEAQADQRWHECVWEDLNDAIDKYIGGIVKEAVKEYELPWTSEGDGKFGKLWSMIKPFLANSAITALGNIAEYALDLSLDFVLYLDSQHGRKVRNRLRTRIAEVAEFSSDGIVLVAHSLGSVIAYDVLAEAHLNGEALPVKHLVTFGSPLEWTHDLRKTEEKDEGKFTSIGGIPWLNFRYKEDYVTRHRELSKKKFKEVKNVLLPLPPAQTASSFATMKSHCAYWTDERLAKQLQEIVAG